jgi:signal transduction histidine kinase
VNGGLTRRVVVASGLLVVVVAAAFAVLLLAIDDTRDSARLASHSQAELTAAGALERLVVDVETGERGYVITSKERFLAPWNAARRALPEQSERLVRLTDNPEQRQRARGIVRAITSYLREYSIPLVNAVRRGDSSARSVVTTLEGKRRVDAIRARFKRFVATERTLVSRRRQNADDNARYAVIAASGGLAGSIVLILLFSGYLTRAIVLPVRRASAMAGRLAGGDLTVRMPETGAGEIGALERAFNTMGSSLDASHADLRRIAEEQAALRRVATLVAGGASPGEVLKAVAGEVGALLDADSTKLLRYEPDAAVTSVAGWSQDGEARLEERFAVEDESIADRVRSSGRAAGSRGSVGAPIVVEGQTWGVMVASWRDEQPLSGDVEARMAEFTELVATAIANAESRAELTESRARVVAAGDETRRRIERDLHDGTQQRLVSLGLEIRAAEGMVPPELTELRLQLSNTAKGLAGTVEELQEISRGIHPAILSKGGLGPALRTLARRSAIPVELEVRPDRRLPQPIEAAAYYVVSEALTNAAKHSHASAVRVDVETEDGVVQVSIRDDGVGGAAPGQGSGLIGLKDRVEALGGEIEIKSPAGSGTSLRVKIPMPR